MVLADPWTRFFCLPESKIGFLVATSDSNGQSSTHKRRSLSTVPQVLVFLTPQKNGGTGSDVSEGGRISTEWNATSYCHDVGVAESIPVQSRCAYFPSLIPSWLYRLYYTFSQLINMLTPRGKPIEAIPASEYADRFNEIQTNVSGGYMGG